MDLQVAKLDEDELLQLAIQASQQDRHDQAITFLKEAVVRNPENANVIYFLGAEHAQIGLYQRAMEEMQRAIDLNPNLHTARFQLGLLYLTSAMVEPCLTTLEPLKGLGKDHYFCCFATGLEHLIRDEFVDCKQWLSQGIALNLENPALNGDMERILEAIKDKIDTPAETVSEKKASEGGSLWLSAYQNDDDDKKH